MILGLPQSVEILSEGARHGFNGSSAELNDVRINCQALSDSILVTLNADKTPVSFITLKWRLQNQSRAVRVFSDVWERGYGDMGWYPIIPHRRMPWVFAISNGSDSVRDTAGRFTECFGIKVRPSGLVTWQFDATFVTLNLDVRSGGAGVILGGRELKVCEIKSARYENISAFESLNLFYKTLCDDAILPQTPVYGSNNWYYAYGHSCRAQILKDARLIGDLCASNPVKPYMVIDAGWSDCPGSGPWDHGNPDYGDMKTLAEEIFLAGAIPGIWVRFLSDEDGKLTQFGDDVRLNRNRKYLDPSHPEVIEFVRQTAKMLSTEWGYKLIKHDFSCFDVFGDWGANRPDTLTDDGWQFYDRSRTSAEIMVNLYREIYESAARGTIILACNVPGFLSAGLCHINRAGDDTSGVDWERTRRMGVNTAAFRQMCDNNFYKADFDCVGITGKIPWRLNREWARLLSSTGTPLFFSTDPDAANEAELAEISEFLKRGAAQTDTAIPTDWMETTCPESWLINGELRHLEFS